MNVLTVRLACISTMCHTLDLSVQLTCTASDKTHTPIIHPFAPPHFVLALSGTFSPFFASSPLYQSVHFCIPSSNPTIGS